MTKITHHTNDYEFIGYSTSSEILKSDNSGSFLYFPSDKNNTKFNGVFYFDKESKDMVKTINSITKIETISSEKEIIVKGNSCNRKGENIYFIDNSIIFITENINKESYSINLDVRKIYDFDNWDKSYQTYRKDDDTIIVDYKKREYNFSLFFYSKNISFSKIDKWTKEEYSKDVERNSPPYEYYTYDCMNLDISENMIICIGKNHEECENNLKKLLEKNNNNSETYIEKIKLIEDKNIKINEKLSISDNRIKQAYVLALNSIEQLTINIDENNTSNNNNNSKIQKNIGIFAGLPWFFQFWTRDEAISTGALIETGKYSEAKNILLREISKILPDGRLGNRYPESMLGSADGYGIAYNRIHRLFKKLDKEKIINEIFSEEEIQKILNLLESTIKKIKENYMKSNGLIYNGPKETWMDTDETIIGEKDTREGYSIEIQALFADMLSFREFLYKKFKISNINIIEIKEDIKKEKDIFITKIRELMIVPENKINLYYNIRQEENIDKTRKKEKDIIVDRIKQDNKPDYEIRPNIFLAYYFCKDIFTKKLWTDTFNFSLEHLWCDWGGLATISKFSKLFCDHYTGQNNFSYHRGDSWFFVNNIAAISMNDLNSEDKTEFEKYIENIKEASTKDILFNGIIGHSSEISDAKQLSSKASPCQAWSASTLIELISRTS